MAAFFYAPWLATKINCALRNSSLTKIKLTNFGNSLLLDFEIFLWNHHHDLLLHFNGSIELIPKPYNSITSVFLSL